MYHPPRGGVRGGADQFKWEDVKSDKHRENYLGHSVKAPVGRWQKGKDLLWYSKDRSSDKNGTKKSDTSEISAIKREEEEAMLAALGHKVVRKETQPLTKEEMTEVLKRNTAERDTLNVERTEGVGVMSARSAMLVNSGSQKGSKAEGIPFETTCRGKNASTFSDNEKQARSHERKMSSKKASKKHRKEKKHKKKKKYKRHSSESDSADEGNDKSSFHKRTDKGKHCNETNSSKSSKYSSEVNLKCSQKSHKPSLQETWRDAKHRGRKSGHDSSSECDSALDIVKHFPKSGHHSKRKRHYSSSFSD